MSRTESTSKLPLKVLIIYDYFSPGYKSGGPTQSLANLVRMLGDGNGSDTGGSTGSSQGGDSIRVICTNEDFDGSTLQVPVDQWVRWNDAADIASSQPMPAPVAPGDRSSADDSAESIAVWYASQNKRDIVNLISQDEVLFINAIFSHHFNYPALLKTKACRKIISPRGMLDPGSLSQKGWKKKLYLAYWKFRRFHKQVEFHAASAAEKNNIQRVFGEQVKIWQVPNFPRVMDYQRPEKAAGQLQLITVALISPMKNHLRVLQALQQVRAQVVYNIYGPVKDKEYWEDCRALIKGLPVNVRVVYHDDIAPPELALALRQGQVAILPSKSENFGHSIFEAFTAGKPVITSHNTPWNHLEDKRAGLNVDPENVEALAAAIEKFAAMEQEEFEEWSRMARTYALEAIDIEAIKKGYLEMFRGE